MRTTTNLCEYLQRSADAFPERIAVVDPSGRQLSYRELHDQARRIAGFLIDGGVRAGDRVGVVAPKGVDVVATLFGIMAAGAAYVPADFTAPAARNRAILSDCAVRMAFVHEDCAAILEDWPAGEPPPVVWMGDATEPDARPSGAAWADAVQHPPMAESRLAPAEGLAYILYTSGSTGTPKGVALTHANAICFVDWCSRTFHPGPQDRFSSHAPFHFDLSILDLYVSIGHGAALHLISEQAGKSPHELAEFIESRALSVWYSTPSILSLLAQFGGLDGRNCSALRLVLFAGEVFPVKHLRSIAAAWPQAEFYNLYGPTETNVCTFARIPTPIPADRVEPYPIGALCDYCAGLVLDSPGGRVLEPGEEGLLHIAGDSLFQGYWNRAADGLFFSLEGERYFNTGDVVRESATDGYVYVGRRDRMVKRRGYRIELGEVERGLYQNDKVREAAVISVPDAASGVRILAYVVPQPEARPSIVELKSFCGRHLPSYMNPDAFVLLDRLPRTSTDKVDYQGLARLTEERRG